MRKVIVAVLAISFVAWLQQLLGLDNVFGRTLTVRPVVLTWNGYVAVTKRSDPPAW